MIGLSTPFTMTGTCYEKRKDGEYEESDFIFYDDLLDG